MNKNLNILFEEINKYKINFFTGVPDSVLKHFSNLVDINKFQNLIASNEGSAVGIAAGYYLTTKKTPVVYLQNAGLGNIINPVLSLIHKDIYEIPMIFIIGWRGDKNKKDEPQHRPQGKKTEDLLKIIDMPYFIIKKNSYKNKLKFKKGFELNQNKKKSVAFLIERDSFLVKEKVDRIKKDYKLMSRKEVIKSIIKYVNKDLPIIATTGYTSRELINIETENTIKQRYFLNVGAMGYASSLTLGMCLGSKKRFLCIDGDGSMIMHMGSLTNIGTSKINNLVHIVINNGVHDSVGGQENAAKSLKLSNIAKACGYKKAIRIDNKKKLEFFLKNLNKVKSSVFIEVLTKKGSSGKLLRPSLPLKVSKSLFMKNFD